MPNYVAFGNSRFKFRAPLSAAAAGFDPCCGLRMFRCCRSITHRRRNQLAAILSPLCSSPLEPLALHLPAPPDISPEAICTAPAPSTTTPRPGQQHLSPHAHLLHRPLRSPHTSTSRPRRSPPPSPSHRRQRDAQNHSTEGKKKNSGLTRTLDIPLIKQTLPRVKHRQPRLPAHPAIEPQRTPLRRHRRRPRRRNDAEERDRPHRDRQSAAQAEQRKDRKQRRSQRKLTSGTPPGRQKKGARTYTAAIPRRRPPHYFVAPLISLRYTIQDEDVDTPYPVQSPSLSSLHTYHQGNPARTASQA